jgi:peptide/nickel transport system permease protein
MSTVSLTVVRGRESEATVTPRSYYGEVWYRFVRDKSAVATSGLLLVIILASALAPLLTTQDPLQGNVAQRLLPLGTAGHMLGTDEQGRDMLARLLYGGRLSLVAGIVPVFIASAIGTAIGTVAAYAGRLVGAVLMRIMDVCYAFPAILLAIALVASLGAGILNSILALSIVFIPPISRVAESATRQVVVQEYVEAARVSGASGLLIIVDQLLPNVFSPIFVYASGLVGLSIVAASGLSYLGLGAAPPAPEWGAMLNSLQSSIYVQPAVVALPGLFIFVTSITFNVLSNALRDALDVRGVGRS